MPAHVSKPDQLTRLVRLATPFGPDHLVLTRFDGQEGLSELFEFRIGALSDDENIDFDKAIGRNCCVSVQSYNGVTRHFNGVLTEAEWTGVEGSRNAYTLVLRPWLWLLGRRSDCRLFHDKSPVDIVEDVFNRAGFSDFAFRVSRGDYPKIPYCVQYRETDLAFVSRLLEEWGIYGFFRHGPDKHELILADSRSSHVPAAMPGGIVPFIRLDGPNRRDCEFLSNWTSERRFRTGKIALNDFDYMKPTADIKTDAQGAERYEKSRLEIYDYPGRYTERDHGRSHAKVLLEAEQAGDRRRHATGDAINLYPGSLCTLKGHPTDDGQYLVVRSVHRVVAEQYRSGGGGGGGGDMYVGHYEMQPGERAFRAPRLTPKPLVHGPQTALVVARKGKDGEEIDVDEEGRIFVQFHWNRDKDLVSRPVRVAQMLSGKGWGSQFIPRVGQEVVVEFLEGDPDQPLVVGTVYNKDYRYPYDLPSKKTMTGLKTDSSKGHNGYNEFVFEDKKGEEKISLRAEKDQDTVVRHAETRTVGETFETPVGSPSSLTTVKKGDMNLAVETGDLNAKVAQKIKVTANVMLTLEVGPSKIEMTPAGIVISAPLIKLN